MARGAWGDGKMPRVWLAENQRLTVDGVDLVLALGAFFTHLALLCELRPPRSPRALP
jgi:hypothetical protein